MAATSVVSYQVTPAGRRETRRVVSGTGTVDEITEVLAGEHRCSASDIVIHACRPHSEPLTAPQTTGRTIAAPSVEIDAMDLINARVSIDDFADTRGTPASASSSSEGGMSGPPEPANIPSQADINGMRKQQLYDLAAQHSVPVDDDPSVADLKKRLITKLHG